MFSYFLESFFCFLVFYIFYFLVLKNETLFQRNRYYLLITSILALVIPLLDFGVSTQTKTTLLPITLDAVAVGVNNLEKGIKLENTLLIWISRVYGIITFILLGKFLFHIFKLLQVVHTSEVLHCRGYLLVNTQGKLPTFSFLNYLFWDNTRQLNESEEDKILAHELKHIWDKHSYDIIYIEFLKIFLWFNPIVYLYSRSLRLHHEYIADAFVLRETDSKTYGKLIIRSLFEHLDLKFTHSFNQAEIKQRLKVMNQLKTPAKLSWKVFWVLPVMICLLMAFSVRGKKEVKPKLDSENGEKIEMNRFATAKGGLDKLYQELNNVLVYPTSAKSRGITGKVFIKFTVLQDGSLDAIHVTKGFDEACDKAALEAFKKVDIEWLPAKVNGVPVKQSLFVPIIFSLK